MPAPALIDVTELTLSGSASAAFTASSVVTVTTPLLTGASLTITAQAERAMSLWPNKGEADPRPPVGEGYRQVNPVAPVAPAGPAGPGTT